jgi:hypothetical protein
MIKADRLPQKEIEHLRAGYKGGYAFLEKIDIEGVNHPKRIFKLTEGLIRRKYSDSDIELILGGNFNWVLTTIWTVWQWKAIKLAGPIHHQGEQSCSQLRVHRASFEPQLHSCLLLVSARR